MDELIEAIEADRAWSGDTDLKAGAALGLLCGLVSDRYEWMERAYHGSLDAALRLHEELLPGWVVRDFTQYPLYWHIVLNGNTAPHFFHGKDPSPARAWLLAILRALKAQHAL